MKIRVLTIGKKHETWVEQGIEHFQKRLRAPFELEIAIIAASKLPGEQASENESEMILKRLKPTDFVILLDERGTNLSSVEFSRLIQDHVDRQIVIIIGGAFGVNQAFKTRADFTWSLSNLVFPHQLVRLMLVEQLYRAQEIAKGTGYHHD
ncbi:23S rRNA (pseudouridine(1915)-N(3))-methyltransferase RlmH [Candidatus Saccharibacteria bacterium]|nr:23S rRNA (pseudouridine(1915)-N(3))-methyltransferase RlmH [Candidatus Saccharibacteria bacterium]